jgi:hypothetical protein
MTVTSGIHKRQQSVLFIQRAIWLGNLIIQAEYIFVIGGGFYG